MRRLLEAGNVARATKTYWITGATSGIGLALAEQLLARGNFVIASGRNLAHVQVLQGRYPSLVACLPFDCRSDEDWRALPGRLAEIVDEIDCLIMAAGVCNYIDQPNTPVAAYQQQFAVNFFAAVQTVNVALPLLQRSSHRGRIVGIGSLAARVPFTRAQAYGASKAALEYWLGCQRLDLESRGVDVTVVSPGFVDTPMTHQNDFAMPGLMSAGAAARIILRGLDRQKAIVRFPRRLAWPLFVAQCFPKLWFGWLADRLQRNRAF